ncbi:N-acyl homoserine lactonase family protein [Pseudarthrobacter sp. fls2-241-R2A-168]|uniref:N-acyl homoserine lactonase family protein n=1 Tax=Pseudarthrobacter sp. fls2-241-R2A-168 TaxID=3040304 RepID=UPI0025534F92|nr:N-acyl homoserine lactonase family protein [Pseudarthrobacter sp. fls2-241-R2A-168]
MGQQWKITAARVGALRVPSRLLSSNGGDDITSAPIIMWVLQSAHGIVVFDTGIPPSGSPAALRHGLQEGYAGESPRSVLSELGIDPLDVQSVVISHLHWDHCSNLSLFPNARIIVQERELSAVFRPPEGQERAYDSPAIGLMPPWGRFMAQVQAIKGDLDLLPGLRVLHLPGHTPGSQGLLVSTAAGSYILPGDLVPVASNLECDPPLLPGVVSSASEALFSLLRLSELGAAVLGSHDKTVFPSSSHGVVALH